MTVRFTLTGRLVQGDPSKAFPRLDRQTKQPKLGANGQPINQFFGAIAIPKNPAERLVIPGNPTFEEVKALLDADARASWPAMFGQRHPQMQYPTNLPLDCINPKFANKIVDGDGFDDSGQPNSAKEGWAGCWVVKCANGFAPKLYEWTASGWQETIHTGRAIKCGDYVTFSGNCESNKSADSPGMYMNFDTVSFEKEGPFIASASSVDPNAALGQRGAPTNPPAAHAPGGAPHQPATAPAAYTGAPAPSPRPSTTVAPYSDYRQTTAVAAPPPPPAGPQMLPAANGIPYESYRAQGWSDDQLRQAGMMA